MTTTAPSWLDAWPAAWPDVGAAYEETVPRQYPEGLYDPVRNSDEYLDVKATARILAWVAQATEWVRRRIFPQADTGGLFLARWEAALGLLRAGTTAARAARITAALRTRKTLTKATVQAIFGPLLRIDPGVDEISFIYPSPADLIAAVSGCSATEIAQALGELCQIGIYSINGACDDLVGAEREARRRQPAWERWWIGTTTNGDGYLYADETLCDHGAAG